MSEDEICAVIMTVCEVLGTHASAGDVRVKYRHHLKQAQSNHSLQDEPDENGDS